MEDVVDDLRWALTARAGRRPRHSLPPPAVAGRRALLRRRVVGRATGTGRHRPGPGAPHRRPGADLVGDADRLDGELGAAAPRGADGLERGGPGGRARRPATRRPRPSCSPRVAIDELELGRVDLWEEHSAAAVAIARRERLPYVMFTVHWVRMTLAAMRGDRAGVEEHLAGLATTSREVALPMAEVHAPAAAMIASLWDGTVGETIGPMLAAFEHSGQIDAPVHQMLARAGRLDDLRRLLARLARHRARPRRVVAGQRLVHGGRGGGGRSRCRPRPAEPGRPRARTPTGSAWPAPPPASGR